MSTCKQGASIGKVGLVRAAFSSPAGLQHLSSADLCLPSALRPLAAELEDLVGLFSERSEKPLRSEGTSNDSDGYGSDSSEARVPVVNAASAPQPPHLRTARRGLALRVRALLILAAVVGLLHTGRRWATDGWAAQRGQTEAAEADVAEAEGALSLHDASQRSYLKAGSIYQNAYMTLWSANNVPISVTLTAGEGDSFELHVSNLDSAGGGSEGWFAVRGNFKTEAMPGSSTMRRIVPEASLDDTKAFEYDPKVLDRACSIAYKCMERVGMLGVVELQVDTKEDAVLVTPRSSIVRLLWDEPVVLSLTTKDNIWKPQLAQESSDVVVDLPYRDLYDLQHKEEAPAKKAEEP